MLTPRILFVFSILVVYAPRRDAPESGTGHKWRPIGAQNVLVRSVKRNEWCAGYAGAARISYKLPEAYLHSQP